MEQPTQHLSYKKLAERSEKIGYRKLLIKDFELPNGTIHDYTIVDARNGAAGIFAITKENKIVVARQFRPGNEIVMDETPGGMIDPGETPLEAAKRELREETGYVAGTIEPLVALPRDAYVDGLWHYFLARDCERVDDIPMQGEHEFIEILEISVEELLENIRQGKMTDAAAALFALRSLGW